MWVCFRRAVLRCLRTVTCPPPPFTLSDISWRNYAIPDTTTTSTERYRCCNRRSRPDPLAAILAVGQAPATQAAPQATFYVNGATGSDSNNCLAPGTACATIGAAVSKASANDTIEIASGVYFENAINVDKRLTINGAGAESTIVDGGQNGRIFNLYVDGSISRSHRAKWQNRGCPQHLRQRGRGHPGRHFGQCAAAKCDCARQYGGGQWRGHIQQRQPDH